MELSTIERFRNLCKRVSMVSGFICVVSFSMVAGIYIGANDPDLCIGCSHMNHENRTCLKQVPCIVGTVGCTCEGMELTIKRMEIPGLKIGSKD